MKISLHAAWPSRIAPEEHVGDKKLLRENIRDRKNRVEVNSTIHAELNPK